MYVCVYTYINFKKENAQAHLSSLSWARAAVSQQQAWGTVRVFFSFDFRKSILWLAVCEFEQLTQGKAVVWPLAMWVQLGTFFLFTDFQQSICYQAMCQAEDSITDMCCLFSGLVLFFEVAKLLTFHICSRGTRVSKIMLTI